MITIDELLSGNKFENLSEDLKNNGLELLAKINKVRAARANPMIVTSGLRTPEHHIEIYKNIAKKNNKIFDSSKVPMGSAHLKFAAVDISDPDGSLMTWTKANEPLLKEIGLWVEDDLKEARVHYQIFAPKSNTRFFKP